MIYCLNPHCRDRLNPDNYKFCQSCGAQLLLRNRYRVVKFLGSGGFGRTYLAVDQDCMNVKCVVKQFSPSLDIQADPAALQKATELFNHEAVQLLQLGEHPQIPRLLAFFEQEKYLYLVQEFIDGRDLRQELAIEGTFSEQKIRQLLLDLLPVLQFIHAKGVIHRDIKPGNIMRRRTPTQTSPAQGGGRGRLMLIDFGVSKQATGTDLGRVGTTVGTAGFTPLEQMRGKAYPASDLYSLGVTCVCLLTKHLPGTDGFDEIYNGLECRWMWRQHLPPGITISPQLGQVLDKLLQDLPKDRYKSAAEVLQSLQSETSQPLSLSTATPTPVIPAPFEYKHPLGDKGDNSKPTGENGKTLDETSALGELTLPPSSPPVPTLDVPPAPLLILSELGIDYSQLQQLLASEKWQEADRETRELLFKVSGREQEGWIRAEDFQKFPCQDLGTIDRLWVHYSKGRFGFSVQKRIWESVKGRLDNHYTIWSRFGDRVGWRVKGNWLTYAELTFDPDVAPLGHLPAGGLEDIVLGKWDLVGCSLALRLIECNIQG
ncbi:GUN4 domain-containing protein [Allocoleopsis sp.]|uniref:GUN4 domain-containing protein n=1 Tax=Allocoleopsis sp. TaxID=3088169 RepID=UPI002FD67E9C